MRFQPFPAAVLGRMAVLGLVLVALAACTGSGVPKQLKPVPPGLVSRMSELNMKETAPIFMRIFKESSEFEVWKQRRDGTYALLKTYAICKWSGALGPKKVEGDRQAPEGFYTVTPAQMNPNSSYYLSFNIGYPNAYDRSLGRTGANLMVHGACSSAGCYSMTDDNAGEIFALARDSFRGGQRAFQIQALPFRMTPENLARHRDDPNMSFWKMLKVGYDTFELTRVPPKVDVCDRRYVFNANAGGASFDASAPCPAYSLPPALEQALAAKQAADDQAIAVASVRLDADAAQAAEEKRLAAERAAADERRAAERAAQPSLVSRVLSTVGGGDETATSASAPAAGKSDKQPGFVSRMLAKVGIGRDKAPAKTKTPPVVANVPPPAAAAPAPEAFAAVPPPRVRPEDTATGSTATGGDPFDDAFGDTAADAGPDVAAGTPPVKPKVGRFVKKKFLWDDEIADDPTGADPSGL